MHYALKGSVLYYASGLDICYALCVIPLMTISADKIRAVRTMLDESQTAFAARFGVRQTTVSRWETRGVPDHGPTKMMVERLLLEVGAG